MRSDFKDAVITLVAVKKTNNTTVTVLRKYKYHEMLLSEGMCIFCFENCQELSSYSNFSVHFIPLKSSSDRKQEISCLENTTHVSPSKGKPHKPFLLKYSLTLSELSYIEGD